MTHIGSPNVRTLKSEANLTELNNALEEREVEILGLTEIRREAKIFWKHEKVTCSYVWVGQGVETAIGF